MMCVSRRTNSRPATMQVSIAPSMLATMSSVNNTNSPQPLATMAKPTSGKPSITTNSTPTSKCNDSVTSTECRPIAEQKKTAHFSKRTRVYLIPTLSEYSDKEYADCWRGDDDEMLSQDHLVGTIQMARKHRSSIPSTHANVMTIRGIEHLCSADAMQRRKCTKKAYLDAVLDEQDLQWTDDVDKTEKGKDAIRAIATRHSKHSKEVAIARATEDAAFVKSLA